MTRTPPRSPKITVQNASTARNVPTAARIRRWARAALAAEAQVTIRIVGATEGRLLEYLATNAGRVLSRTMIVEHVWDQSFEGLTNIVDVYIRHLRSKIDDRFPTKLIHTVRGIGYMLESPERSVPQPAPAG